MIVEAVDYLLVVEVQLVTGDYAEEKKSVSVLHVGACVLFFDPSEVQGDVHPIPTERLRIFVALFGR